MPVQLGAGPQPDFEQPLDLMMDCHRRIERFLDVLIAVADSKHGGPLDEEHRKALETALNYFQSAATRHTEDEERSLFPRMRRSKDPRVQQALGEIKALEDDHLTAQMHHERIDTLGRRWLADDSLPRVQVDELRHVLRRLRETYARHIRLEDEQIFPLAGRTLSAEQLTEIGSEMKARRAQDPGRPGSRCAQRRQRLQAENAPQGSAASAALNNKSR